MRLREHLFSERSAAHRCAARTCSVECEIETQEHLSAAQTQPTKDNCWRVTTLRGLREAVREEAEADGWQPKLLEDVVRGKPVGNNGPVLGGGQVPR